SNGVSQAYKLVGVLDNGATGTVTFNPILLKVDGSGDDEKVTSFPAVAGDIVFFTTTSFKPQTPCTAPDAKLYALTFIGGPAYDTNADNKFDNSEATIVWESRSGPALDDVARPAPGAPLTSLRAGASARPGEAGAATSDPFTAVTSLDSSRLAGAAYSTGDLATAKAHFEEAVAQNP